MEPQVSSRGDAARTSDLDHHGASQPQYLTITDRPSAASSLRRMYSESVAGTASGVLTPETVDERTSLLGEHDIERGKAVKKSPLGAL